MVINEQLSMKIVKLCPLGHLVRIKELTVKGLIKILRGNNKSYVSYQFNWAAICLKQQALMNSNLLHLCQKHFYEPQG